MAHKTKSQTNYIIRRGDSIGTGDAESDQYFLATCFVDTGLLEILRDTTDPRRIVLGRTGTGKTALLQRLADTQDNTIIIEPEALAFRYVSNSNIIQFVESLGVRLDPFYKLMWNHIIAVELIKKKFNIKNRSQKNNFFESILSRLNRDKSKEEALHYIDEWGDQFWENTDTRVKDITKRIETSLKTAIGANVKYFTSKIGLSENISEEERREITDRAKEVVNDIQIKDLNSLMKLLSEDLFSDIQNTYYIVIDGLDEDWVDDVVRYRLIKALMDCVRQFMKVQSVKIVVSLRTDVLYKVISETKTTGSQQEKYEGLYLHLRWSKNQLKELIDKRISYLFKRKYTGANIKIDHLLSKSQIQKNTPFDYIMERTFLRPRETIQFVNDCLDLSDGRTKLTTQIILSAERSYSEKRLSSLYDEWRSVYPNLHYYVDILKNKPAHFSIKDIYQEEVEEFVLNSIDTSLEKHGPMRNVSRAFFDNKYSNWGTVLNELLWHLFLVGIVGVKTDPHSMFHWSYLDRVPISKSQCSELCKFQVHPTFWLALGSKP